MNNPLAKLNAATKALAEAKTLDDIKKIHDIAQAAEAYARAAKLGLEAQNHAAEVKLRAERKAGELLAELERGKTGPKVMSNDGHNSAYARVLDETQTTRQDASRWQEISKIPEPKFEAYIEENRKKDDGITTAGAIRVSRADDGRPMFSSERQDWTTPQIIIDKTVDLFGQIDLDPCGNPEFPHIPAEKILGPEDDGLKATWAGRVYMNPPYGNEIKFWIEKVCSEYEAGNIKGAIVLVPARTDTEWFRRMKPYPRCFIWGRLKFGDSGNSAPFPSMAVYLGKEMSAFMRAFSDMGDIYQLAK